MFKQNANNQTAVFFICSQHLRNDAYFFLHNRLAQAVAIAATVKLLLNHFCTRILSLPRSPVFIMLSIMLRFPNISAKIKKLLPTPARHMIETLIFFNYIRYNIEIKSIHENRQSKQLKI